MQSRSVAGFEPRGSGPLGGFTSGTFSGQMSVCHGVDTFTQKHWPGEVGLCQPEVPGVGPIETDNWDNILKLLLLLIINNNMEMHASRTLSHKLFCSLHV